MTTSARSLTSRAALLRQKSDSLCRAHVDEHLIAAADRFSHRKHDAHGPVPPRHCDTSMRSRGRHRQDIALGRGLTLEVGLRDTPEGVRDPHNATHPHLLSISPHEDRRAAAPNARLNSSAPGRRTSASLDRRASGATQRLANGGDAGWCHPSLSKRFTERCWEHLRWSCTPTLNEPRADAARSNFPKVGPP